MSQLREKQECHNTESPIVNMLCPGGGGEEDQQPRCIYDPGQVGRVRPQPHLGGSVCRRQHLQFPQAHLHLHGEPPPGAPTDHPGAHGDGHHEVWGHRRAGGVLVRVWGESALLVLCGATHAGV